MATRFFNMPEEKGELFKALNAIQPLGGGDDDEDGLEALAFAIRSAWTPEVPGIDRRQVIVLWTDAGTHELGYGKNSSVYPEGMAKDFKQLQDWWGETDDRQAAEQGTGNGYMDYFSKRLLLFAPGKIEVKDGLTKKTIPTLWNKVFQWSNTQWVETQPGQFDKNLNEVQRASYYSEKIILPLVKTITKKPNLQYR